MLEKLDLKNRILGTGHRIFTVLGLLAGAVVAFGQYLDVIPEQYRSQKWYIVAVGLVAAGAWWRKNIAPAALALLLLCIALPARADWGVICLSEACRAKDAAKHLMTFQGPGPGDTALSSTVWAGPGISLMPFVYNGATNKWQNPLQAAVSYGLWWAPPGYKATKSLLGVNLAISGQLDDASHIDPLLTVTLFDNLTIGGGARFNFATGGQRSGVNPLFAVGWQTSIGGP